MGTDLGIPAPQTHPPQSITPPSIHPSSKYLLAITQLLYIMYIVQYIFIVLRTYTLLHFTPLNSVLSLPTQVMNLPSTTFLPVSFSSYPSQEIFLNHLSSSIFLFPPKLGYCPQPSFFQYLSLPTQARKFPSTIFLPVQYID